MHVYCTYYYYISKYVSIVHTFSIFPYTDYPSIHVYVHRSQSHKGHCLTEQCKTAEEILTRGLHVIHSLFTHKNGQRHRESLEWCQWGGKVKNKMSVCFPPKLAHLQNRNMYMYFQTCVIFHALSVFLEGYEY